jgi:hypothetical protein
MGGGVLQASAYFFLVPDLSKGSGRLEVEFGLSTGVNLRFSTVRRVIGLT